MGKFCANDTAGMTERAINGIRVPFIVVSIASVGLGLRIRQALRVVVGNLRAGDLVERVVLPSGVTHQLRGIPVDPLEIGAVRVNPLAARSAGDGSVEPLAMASCEVMRHPSRW